MNDGPARLVFQCAVCRALASAQALFVDETKTRAALMCDVCGAGSWLPLAVADQARVVDVTAAPPVVGRPTLPSASSPGPAPLPDPAPLPAPRPATPAPAPAAPAAASSSPWTPEQLERIRARLSAIPTDKGGHEVADAFVRLLSTWGDAQEHRQLLRKASSLGRLADAGQRYRVVLEEAPGDATAKRAQGEIIGMAMTTMQVARDAGAASAEGRKTRRSVGMAVVLLVAVAIGAVYVLPRLLRAGSGEAMIEESPGVISPGAVAGESAR